MNILLIGEFSRLHNSLKEGLVCHGHEVTIIGTGDGFKKYPIDICIKNRFLENKKLHFLAKAIHRITNISLVKVEYAYRYFKQLHKLKHYDVVQLINENSFKANPKVEIWLLKKIIKHNKKVFLLSCGADYSSIKYAFDKKLKYSILTPFNKDESLQKKSKHMLRFLKPKYKKLHDFLFENVNGVIASDLDYHLPLINHPKYLGLIPNPINTDKINFIENKVSNKVNIFHGISIANYAKKGNIYFEEALATLKDKYPDKVHIETTKNVPYKTYITLYNNCNILLDQTYSYDQGFNALEAMAKGKVVFTGAEQEWLDYYNLKEDTIVINAIPNTQKLIEKLEWLILNPDKINEISKNARAFVESHHNYKKIAQLYLDTWQKN
ncbi:glycosyl transferase family 1 [Tamlana sedimentorum]|uniref:Glycosyl transferase family 1 n=1 Tax=Neotamlana sedimentorum TaxID=1435349 RepID=A0A0D7W7H6_9FLAO|nr:glycosyltransferase [Tamlana sedimentorum]KJD35066.1 glycosyl transferase family 1 [Tamlana sedimentorum]